MGTHELSRSVRALIVASFVLVAAVAYADDPQGPDTDAGTTPLAPAEAPAEPTVPSDVPQVPLDQAPPPIKSDWEEWRDKIWSGAKEVIPIPEIILDPNEGNTYGLMGVWLLTDEKDEIKYMVAPDFRWNDTKGSFPSFRLFGYPTDTRRYTITLGKSTTRDEDYEIEYSDRGLMDEKAFILAKFLYERDSTERFYGFGNESDENRESNYTGEDLYLDATPGYWILPQVNVSYRMRIRRHNVQPGQVSGLPFVGTEFPFLYGKGIESAVYWQHRLAITYDTRDSMDMPKEGTYVNAYVDGADRHVGSATSFVAFGVEGKAFVPFRGERRNPILALRGELDWVEGGPDTPFWLRSSLGGRRRLRGYGGDRFIDYNRSLSGAERRTRVYERKLFGVNAQLELAPFVETGQVFRHLADSPFDDLHWVGGLGFRGLVRPQVVAFVDVGYGDEGSSVFTGIDYPF